MRFIGITKINAHSSCILLQGITAHTKMTIKGEKKTTPASNFALICNVFFFVSATIHYIVNGFEFIRFICDLIKGKRVIESHFIPTMFQ